MDQDIELLVTVQVPCLFACRQCFNHDNGLNFLIATQPQLNTILYKSYCGHGVSSQEKKKLRQSYLPKLFNCCNSDCVCWKNTNSDS